MFKKGVRQGAPSKGERIALHSRSLASELQDWLKLRIALFEVQLQRQVRGYQPLIVSGLLTLAAGFLAVTFLLVAGALGLGALFGRDAWGFAAIGGSLVLCTWLLYKTRLKNWSVEDVITLQVLEKNDRTKGQTIERGSSTGDQGEREPD